MRKAVGLVLPLCLALIACQPKVVESKNDDPNSPQRRTKAAELNTQLGIGYLRQGDRIRAKKKLLYALELSPKSASANAGMGYYMEKTGDKGRAQKYYLNAINYSGGSGAQLNNYGAFLCRQGNYGQAEEYFLRAVKDVRYVHSAGAYENAAMCAEQIPNYAKAKRYYTKALEQDPDRKVSLKGLLSIAKKQGTTRDQLTIMEHHATLVYNDAQLLREALELAEKEKQTPLADFYQRRLFAMNRTKNTKRGA